MRKSLRLKLLGAFAPAALVATLLATLIPATPSAAASGSKVYSATFNVSCILGPGSLNVAGTVSATLSATGPTAVNTGDSVTLTNGSSSIPTPANWSTSFASIGAVTASGAITSFDLTATGLSAPNPLNIATLPPYGSGGLPWGPVNVVSAQPLTFTAPNTGSLSIGPYTVTGASGTNLVIQTGGGNGSISATATGFDATNTAVVGPLPVSCNPPATPVVIGSVPIGSGTTTSSTTTTTPTTTTTTPTTTTTTSSSTTSTTHVIVKFNNWALTGFLTDKRLGQTINLANVGTFNGQAVLTANTFSGYVAVPAFSANVKIFGFLPTTVGLNMVEASPVSGSIGPDPNVSGNLVVNASAKVNIYITAVGLFGINIPTTCKTATPVTFPLQGSFPALQLTTGATFTGTTTLPAVQCGGILGGLLSPVLTALFSGPGNAYSLSIAPQPTTTTTTTTTSSSTTSTHRWWWW